MTFLDRWAAAWLRSSASGYRVDDPGTPDPRDPVVARRMLCDAGYTVFSPGIPIPQEPIKLADAEAALVSQFYTVLVPGELPPFDRDGVIERLKSEGYGVVRPLQPPPVGSVWVPHPRTDGKRTPPLHATLARKVLVADSQHVIYERDGQVHQPVTLSGWYGWRHKMRAEMQAPAP